VAAQADNQDKQIFEVNLAGLSLKLKTSHNADTVHQLVSYVDQKVSEALKLTKSGSRENAALLASLNIAEELIILKMKAQQEIEKIESKALKVLADLESSRQQVSGFTEVEVRPKEPRQPSEPEVMGIDH
jgi:cell division protein ZapA